MKWFASSFLAFLYVAAGLLIVGIFAPPWALALAAQDTLNSDAGKARVATNDSLRATTDDRDDDSSSDDSTSDDSSSDDGQVAICHIPESDDDDSSDDDPETILVSSDEVAEHLAHGDSLGSCEPPVSTTGPTLDALISPTSDPMTTITGTSLQLDSIIRVEGGLQTEEVLVNADQTFAVSVDLHLNASNHLFVTEIFADGESSPVVGVEVIQDGQPPGLFIDFPPDGAELTMQSTDVAGRVSDLLSGFMGLTVNVNGVPAIVEIGIGTNGTFLAQDVPLTPGVPTAIEATAVDIVGNTVTTQISVTSIEISDDAPFMVATAGNGQEGAVDTQLAEPLVAQVFRGDGSAFAGKVVNFHVDRSNGRLSDGAVGGTMMFQAITDANGVAQAFWSVGSDAGCGNNRVAVTSTDIEGTVFFCASATPGPAKQINIGSGNSQRAEVGGPAPLPLRVWVSDACNGVEGVLVSFTPLQGGGTVDGFSSISVFTGPTGHAEVDFVLGGAPGNNVVEANFPDNPGTSARFVLVGAERIPGQPTSFSGIVLNNGNQAITGVECSLQIAATTIGPVPTDISGQFRFEDIDLSGPATLFVDGLVATHVGGSSGQNIPPGSFPALSYEIVLVPNAQNTLPAPILLPALNPNNARTYDGTQEVELTVEGIEGLAMTVLAGSMTRADGTMPSPADPAIISLNQVHSDDVPMPMPDGAAPPFAWTLQPAGATFDPPVRISYPNMSGLPAGAISYFLSFNHSTNRFEIIGSGQVTDDGASILSDPGVGIATAGWGCNCPPYTITEDCANCNVRVEGPEFACGVPETYTATVRGSGTLLWTITDGGVTSTQEEPVQDGDVVSLSVMFNTPGPAGGPESSGNKVEADLLCDVDIQDQHGVGVTTVLVEFDPVMVKLRDVNTGSITKTLPIVWSSPSEIDLAPFLTDASDVQNIMWSTDSGPFPPGSSVLAFGSEPGEDKVKVFEVTALHKECDPNLPAASDQMYVVVVPQSTQTSYTNWVATNQNSTMWLSELPPVYDSILFANGVPLNPQMPTMCGMEWEDPDTTDSHFHPDASWAIRSAETPGGHGHQATYTTTGQLIVGGSPVLRLAAGTADRSHYTNVFGAGSHSQMDVLPFVWAAQLDGNPVQCNFFCTDLNRSLMRLGTQLDVYLTLRPTLVPGAPILSPGVCPP